MICLVFPRRRQGIPSYLTLAMSLNRRLVYDKGCLLIRPTGRGSYANLPEMLEAGER